MKSRSILAIPTVLIGVALLGESFPAAAKAGDLLRTTATRATEEGPVEGSLNVKNVPPSEYAHLAKISMSEASKIAGTAVSGHIAAVALENEDGSLVYSVEILDSAGLRHEVLVDAGNGKVLRDERKGRSSSKEHDDDDDERDGDRD